MEMEVSPRLPKPDESPVKNITKNVDVKTEIPIMENGSSRSNGSPVKNLLIVSVSIMCLFLATQAIEKLQSSVHFEGGLGTTALGVMNVLNFLTSIFLSAFLTKKFGPKRVLLLSMLGYVANIAVNLKATWFTLMPVAAVNGIACATLYASLWTYIGNLGTQYSQNTGINQDIVYARFYGLFFVFHQASSIWGSLISFEVLDQKSESSRNFSTAACGAHFCDSNVSQDDKNFKDIPKNFYLLCGIFVGIGVLAVAIMCFIDYQEPRQNENDSVKKGLVETLKKLQDPYMLLVFPITFYGGLQVSFINGDYSKAYITCLYGVADVGFVFICYGVVSTLFCLVSGQLVKLFGRKVVFVISTLIDITVYFTLIFYDFRGPLGLVCIFVLIGFLGITFSVWQAQVKALFGSLFPDCQEVAFSLLGVLESLGIATGYEYSQVLCTQPKIYILLGLLFLGMVCYGTVEVLLVREHRRNRIDSVVESN